MTKNTVNSTIVTALEATWAKIRRKYPDVPAAVIVVASGSEKKGEIKFGHYAHGRWARKRAKTRTPEILISGEGLVRGGRETLGTLLHEAAHGVAAAKDLKDTSRGGRYHNKVFKHLAEGLGLKVEAQWNRGLAKTSVPAATARTWAKTIKTLNRAIRKNFRFMEPQFKKERETCRSLLAECSCGRKIRVAKAVFEAAPIICGACEEEFKL